jgi:tyrosinase
VDIEDLGYTYILPAGLVTGPPPVKPPLLRVHGINRAAISGSFLISTWVSDPKDPNGSKRLLDVEAVLSRWHVSGCANCQNHLSVKAFVPLHGLSPEEAKNSEFEVRVHTRQDRHDSRGLGKKLPKPDLQIHHI